MAKKIVLLDCDGPLAELHTATIQVVADLVQERSLLNSGYRDGSFVLPWAPANEWDFLRNLPEDTQEAVIKEWCRPGFAQTLPVVPGALEAVQELQQTSELYVVTAPMPDSPTWCHDRERWLSRNLGIPSNRVIFAKDKHIVHGDILVDDKTSNLRTWADHRKGLSVLWRLWHSLGCSDFIAGETWPEIMAILRPVLSGVARPVSA